ncbi:MAG: cupin domain-containing protein [Desulfobacterales bacterium]
MQHLIERYNLAPHPEGGYYRRIYQSAQSVKSSAAGAERRAVTHIYYLLGRGQISRFHRVLHDEIWNFYEGSPLRLVIFDGTTAREEILGPSSGYAAVVAGGLFQAAESTGDYSLVGCTVAPGFEFEDFSFLTEFPEEVRNLERNASGYNRFL